MQTDGGDYLLSIVNHAILPSTMLSAPSRGAINYHDSLLPSYGGFNATSWAILERQAQHGITWHVMTDEADAGPVLLQQPIQIAEDDTAFTLGVKCSEAGIESFARLLRQMEQDALEPVPQAGQRSFHLRSQRPGVGLLDFTRSAAELSAMVRALDFGPDDSWMVRPKVLLADEFLVVADARRTDTRATSPGEVLRISGGGIEVGTADDAILLSGFVTMDGTALDPVQVATRYGLRGGSRLPRLDASRQAALDQFDEQVTRSERFWVSRLTALVPATLPGVADASSGQRRVAHLPCAEPHELASLAAPDREAVLTAALAVLIRRLGGSESFDLAAPAALPDGAAALFAPIVPFRCVVPSDAPFASVAEGMKREWATHRERITYARDVRQRYRALRDRTDTTPQLRIGIAPASSTTTPSRSESALTLLVSMSEGYGWAYDEQAVSTTVVASIAERFAILLSAALASPQVAVSALPLLPTAERELLLSSWQGPSRVVDEACVHQQFERQVLRSPEAIALACGDEQLTYRALDHRANALAQRLRDAGVGPEVLVGICADRSIEMVVGLLGILKAGGAYVPMDPAYPTERLSMMIEDSCAPIVLTQPHLAAMLPASASRVMLITPTDFSDELVASSPPMTGVRPEHLAYVIFTSGSTGRPKGTMLEHRNVSNFFTGMDLALDPPASGGVWLAVTSISFDISVLELFWALARGFKVVVAPDTSRAALDLRERVAKSVPTAMDFGLFYFAADSADVAGGDAYRLLLEGARFADANGFAAVWTPERHFHAFGGLYPNPAVTSAAIATITERVQIRAGSIVLPLHNPLRVAEDWAVIDQLSKGRVGLSFASGWHVNDFAFMPDAYERRRDVMLEHMDTVLKLWRGGTARVPNGAGILIDVAVLPRPVQADPPIWIASAGSVETFVLAGRLGANVLTNMLGQDLADLKVKFAAYRAARREHGHNGDGIISVMLHTFVCGDTEEARALARKPFAAYLASSFDLVKVAPKMFPAFRQPSRDAVSSDGIDAAGYTDEDMTALLEHAFDRYFDTAGLFGTPERAMAMVEQLAAIGANEVACLVDFGIAPEKVLESLPHLARLQQLCGRRGESAAPPAAPIESVADLIRRHRVTHLQCTPSTARVLANDPDSLQQLGALDLLLLGGEALPADLGRQLAGRVRGRLLNMYGPTETTVWSTTSVVTPHGTPSIGRPIANTTIRVLDEHRELVPIGTAGELYIGGAGVARGYLQRDDLTSERFVPDPWQPGARLYRTGDLVRYRTDGDLEFLGRLDHQVKIRGHRIELAEIEHALLGHASVRDAVVVARAGQGAAAEQHELVAYVVPSSASASNGDSTGTSVDGWRDVWNETYRQTRDRSHWEDPRFRVAGWTDSHNGQQIPFEQMREWRDSTVARIRALDPSSVLEIGCGTGLLLFPLLSHVARYTALDVSHEALDTIRTELSPEELRKVELHHARADEVDRVATAIYDVVVINSVAQYFPDADYLTNVLRRVVGLVRDGGHVFIGDVRSLDHHAAFATSVELQQAPDDASAREVHDRVKRRMTNESELLLSPAFFAAVAHDVPRIADVNIALKAARARNEMTNFRFDVTLRVGLRSSPQPAPPVRPVHAERLEDVRAVLADSPAVVHLTDVLNARLSSLAVAMRSVVDGDARDTARTLRAALADAPPQGIDPGDLAAISDGYDVQIRWAQSGDPWRFDAALVRHGVDWCWPKHQDRPATRPAAFANTPVLARTDESPVARWRQHLARVLPEYMVPSTFVILAELPHTPNGKIDRKALPEPERTPEKPAASYSPPGNELEEQIAQVWQSLLAIERVGRQDNIFDLGANSLLTMQANNRLSSQLGRKVSLVSMFRYPTVASLAEHLREGASNGAPALPAQKAEERSSRAEQSAMRRRALRAARDEQ